MSLSLAYRLAIIMLAFAVFLAWLLGRMTGRDEGFAAAREIYDVRPEKTRASPSPLPSVTLPARSQRTWADLFAACRFADGWLGADRDGEPTCYPMDQEARLGAGRGGR